MPARGVHRVGTDGIGRVGSGQLPEEWQLSHWVKTRDFWNLLGVRVTERFLRPVRPQNQVRVLVPKRGARGPTPVCYGNSLPTSFPSTGVRPHAPWDTELQEIICGLVKTCSSEVTV